MVHKGINNNKVEEEKLTMLQIERPREKERRERKREKQENAFCNIRFLTKATPSGGEPVFFWSFARCLSKVFFFLKKCAAAFRKNFVITQF